MLRLHDTAKGRVTTLSLREPGKCSLYVCGSTVYNDPHIGHGRFTLVFDLLRRYLAWCGIEVDHVSNVTDIDDKIIARANAEGRPWSEVAAQYEEAWWQAMDALGALRPLSTPHASDYLPQMIELISELVRRDIAYETSDGVYLQVSLVEGYGLLARQSLESLRAGARVEVVEEKRSPLDFALWKKAKPGEPTWDSPFGPGRPGWHTECVVMSLGLLGEAFDLHGGGQDLAFPHHENERAQAVALGKTLCNHWMHNGMVVVGGEKMSKSLGNFTTISELLKGTDPRAYRMLVARSYYRSPVEVTPDTIADGEKALSRLDAFARRFPEAGLPAAVARLPLQGNPWRDEELEERIVERFRERMDDDLDTSGAVAAVFDAVRQANTADDEGDRPAALRAARAGVMLAGVLGFDLGTPEEEIDPDVGDLVARREEARRVRDFALADTLKGEIGSLGWVVEDTPQGTRVHKPRSDD